MDLTPYRVLPGANLDLYPRGTKVGDVVHLTEAQALYERDMGRLGSPKDPWPPEPAPDPEPARPEGEAETGDGKAEKPAPEPEVPADPKLRRTGR